MSSSAAYDRKLSEMREYVPFLERMIHKLERAGDRSKETQLAKMKSLRQGRYTFSAVMRFTVIRMTRYVFTIYFVKGWDTRNKRLCKLLSQTSQHH